MKIIILLNQKLPIKEKKKYIVSEAQKAAQKRYYNKIKENPEFQEVRRGYRKNIMIAINQPLLQGFNATKQNNRI